MNQVANAQAAAMSKEEIIAAYTRHWNTKGVMRHQWLAVPSQIGPVMRVKKQQVNYGRR